MKTPMQELLERVKEYRDSETDVMVISRLNSLCVDIVGMLEEEKEVIQEFATDYERECRINLERSIEKCWDITFNAKDQEPNETLKKAAEKYKRKRNL
jgi:hypothetical protein